eukprot:TRINITY_DN5465_c0_g1_i1.p1 TRINITY_DN5465_c0_g1~~TRINITY_DN5465_c0_g1_i1.p1  ORF type:complete len:575 (-),score=76.24 TRINITY_DN5465_c0_g1_i1:57-1781(-)
MNSDTRTNISSPQERSLKNNNIHSLKQENLHQNNTVDESYHCYEENMHSLKQQTPVVGRYRDDNLTGDIFLSMRDGTVDTLYQELSDNHCVYVYGPTFTGKSSLATLFSARLELLNEDFMCFSMLEVEQFHGDINAFFQVKCNGRTMSDMVDECMTDFTFVIDDFQVFFDEDHPSHQKLGMTVKRLKGNPKCRLLFFSSHSRGSTGGLLYTPFSFTRTLGIHTLLFSPEEVNDLCDNFDLRNSKGIQLSQNVRDFLYRYTNGHIGYLSVLLYSLNEDFYKHPESHLRSNEVLNLLSEQKNSVSYHRSVNSLSKNELDILRSLFYKGTIITNSDNIGTIRNLAKHGLIVETPVRQHFRSPTNIDRQLFLETFIASRISSRDEEEFSSLKDFMNQAVLYFDYNLVYETFSEKKRLKSKRIVVYEAHWQSEFCRAVYSLLPYSCRVFTEMSDVDLDCYVYETEKQPELDFYISGDKQWLIGLCSSLNTLQGHLDRLSGDGKYSTLPLKDHIVVYFEANEDTCSKLSQQKKVEIRKTNLIDHENVLYIFYDFSRDCVVTAECTDGYLEPMSCIYPSIK